MAKFANQVRMAKLIKRTKLPKFAEVAKMAQL